MIYPHLTLYPLHISLIINSLLSTSNDYTKVKKLIKLKLKSFFHSNKLYPTHSIILSLLCVSQIFIISKRELIILFLVLKKIQTVFFWITKMSSESQPLVSPSIVSPPLPSTLPWTLADEEALTKRENAISHLQLCIARRDQCEIDLINFRRKYSETVINADPILHSRHVLLMTARKEAWEAYFKAYDALYPKTIEDILWIMAKAGHTQLIAPLMNLSKVTRTCIHLQPLMMNVELGRRGRTQLHHCAENGLTSSVKRLLSIRNINVNVKDLYEWTPLHYAARNGHIEIIRLLLQNGAVVNAKNNCGSTPLHWAASHGHVDILHLLVENGANLEAQDNGGSRALHDAADEGHLPFIQELISSYHVDINARDNYGRTALRARHGEPHPHPTVITFLEANGGIE
jgi:hypothetical protein